MSCSWCTNRSFMVLMSLVKRPMALILFWFREHDSAAVSLPERRYVRLRIQSQPRDRGLVPETCKNLAMGISEHAGVRRSGRTNRQMPGLESAGVKTYVWRVTAMLSEDRSWRCQGLPNGTFLPYGFSLRERLAALFDRRSFLNGF